MASKVPQRGIQKLLCSEFIANFNDTGVDAVTGVSKGFGTTIAENLVMDSNLMPQGAVLQSGELIVETAYVGPTVATVAVTSSVSGTAMLAATSLLATGKTALTGLAFSQMNAGENVRITMATTVAAATAGRFRIRLYFTIDGRAEDVITN